MRCNPTYGFRPPAAGEAVSRAEEIAAKYCGECTCHVAYSGRKLTDPSCRRHNDYEDILDILHEYGQAVRDRDAEIVWTAIDMYSGNRPCANHASAAISKEPLP